MIDFSCLLFVIPVIVLFANEIKFFKADSISKIICIEDILEDLTERVANKNLSPDKYLPKQRIKPKKKTLVSKILESKTSKKI
jgi:hypothetical protein